MTQHLYVSGLPEWFTDSDLEELFSKYGPVVEATVWVDFETNNCKGFGFVEMKDFWFAERAIEALDGKWLHERRLKVRESKRGDS